MKRQVYVAVLGSAMTGKTAVIQVIAEALKANNIEHKIDWGLDGPPMATEEFNKRRVIAVANKTAVYINEQQTRKGTRAERPESYKDLSVIVQYDKDKGYGLEIMVLGHSVKQWYGDLRLGKDRARMIANRLAAELDIDVIDIIPNDLEWVQSKDHE